MSALIELGDLRVDVIRKGIKNLHLSVLPPQGRVRISAPLHMNLDTIRVFVISKLVWIKDEQRKMRVQDREAPREYLDRESHYVWGKRYLLVRVERDAAPRVECQHSTLLLQVRPGTNDERAEQVMDGWYREQLRIVVTGLIAKWEPVMGVKVRRVFVQKMKTKWGSCNASTGAVRLNTDLAKKPPECAEYIVVHEMAHLLEPTHNPRFISLMSMFLPQWQHIRAVLNDLPVRHEEWEY